MTAPATTTDLSHRVCMCVFGKMRLGPQRVRHVAFTYSPLGVIACDTFGLPACMTIMRWQVRIRPTTASSNGRHHATVPRVPIKLNAMAKKEVKSDVDGEFISVQCMVDLPKMLAICDKRCVGVTRLQSHRRAGAGPCGSRPQSRACCATPSA